MLTGARRHPVLVSLGAVTLLVIVAVAVVAWYLIGEERRSGRFLSRVLTRQAGIPVSIERARAEGAFRVVLYNVHVPPGEHWSGDVRVRELRIDGGLMPFLAPRGRALSVVAVSTSVTLAEKQKPMTPPTAEALEALRRFVVQMIEWPAVLSLRIEGGELRSGDEVFTFDAKGEKTETGKLGLSLSISPPVGAPALRLDLAGATAGDQVALRIGVEGEPARLGALWPATLPALARLSLEADGRLRPGGELQLTGRARAERGDGAPPLAAEFASAYRAAGPRLDFSRLALDWGPRLHLDGTGSAAWEREAPTVALDLAGVAEESPLTLNLRYVGSTGAVAVKADIGALDARRLFARLGLAPPPAELTARRLQSTLDGTIEAGQVRLAFDATLSGAQAPALLPDVGFDGTLRGDAALARGTGGLELAALGPTTLTLVRDGAPLAVVTARSRGRAAWPLAVEAAVADLRRMPSPPALPTALTGRAAVSGALDHGRFDGALTLELPRAEVRFLHPIVVTNVRATIPVNWNTPPAAKPGTFSIERLEAYGFALDRLRSPARFAEGRLLLSEIQYTHYGGRGSGWIEAAVDNRPLPLRARIEGEHIDLAAVVREYGLTVAKLSGLVRYLIVFQHSTTRGLTAVGQVSAEEGGGEISIEALEKLINSARVQAEGTGLLRQTLQSLRVFKYSSLEADVRVTRDGGHINLSIEGKKRLGIFPPPVKAINFSNVPIALLARAFAKKETP
jgi:hypothetical protein